ncbi:MAG: hypothetical protein JOZ18_23990 [Chloroflexi bacterium]|nr:hypothetical protein [Chloroflexota bacterium]
MYTIDTTTFGSFLHTLWTLVQGVLRLDPAVFQAVQNTASADLVILTIVFLAGVSITLGQCVVLLVNRVKPGRFVISLLLSGALFVLSIIIEVSIIWLTGISLFHSREHISDVLRAVSLAYAPLLFGFFILLPYAGSLLDHVLDIWCLLAIVVAVGVTLQLQLWQALLCTLCGWLIYQLVKFTLGRPILAMSRWLRRSVAGVPLSLKVQNLAEMLIENPTDHPEGGS